MWAVGPLLFYCHPLLSICSQSETGRKAIMLAKYRIYGLCLESCIDLPELVLTDGTTDVAIRYGHIENKLDDSEDEFATTWATDDTVRLYYGGVGTFLIRHGTEIIIDAEENAPISVIRLAIIGPVISVILHQRNFLVLHGSAVMIDGGAIGIMGNSGDGKSSLAASLQQYGYDLVSDDLSVIDVDASGNFFLRPGYPQLKLWPDLLESAGHNPDTLARVSPYIEKRAKRLTDGFVSDSVPLTCLYVLAVGPDIDIKPINGQEAFMHLIRHSHNALLLEETHTSQQHFQQCAALGKQIPIRSLTRPWSLDRMPEVIRTIEQDVQMLKYDVQRVS